MIKFNKAFVFFSFVICFILCFSFSASAVSYNTYSDMLCTNSTVSNLLSLRSDDELNTDFIVFRASNYDYYLLISDNFNVNGSVVTCSTADYYLYSTDYSSSYDTRYSFGTLSNVNLSISHVVTSNFLDNCSRYYSDSENLHYISLICFFIFAVLLFLICRRFK